MRLTDKKFPSINTTEELLRMRLNTVLAQWSCFVGGWVNKTCQQRPR